jgi:ABC-type polar amino acid transport system ATPase subunit
VANDTMITATQNESLKMPVIKIAGLRKSFDGRLVLDGVDLNVPKGRIVSIIGQSGGGKTTFMRCINLLEHPDHGSIEIGSEKIVTGGRLVFRDLQRLRQRVGMVFQRFNLFPHLTAVENIVLAQMHAAQIEEPQAVKKAIDLLTRVGLAHRAMAYPDQMSGGEQQRVAIARALALGPTVLLFDEPTSALDPESTGEVLRVMRELAAEGMTMVIVTHELPFAREVSDWIVFIDGGRIIEQGRAADILDHPREPRTIAYVSRYKSPGTTTDTEGHFQ